MIKITNEIDGKKYELVPATKICKGCCFDTDDFDCFIEEGRFNGRCVCHMLNGIWKEARDAD